MPSLDGYSLNEKMDKITDRIDNEIKQLRNKVDNELNDINLKFNELQSYIKTIKPIKEKSCQKPIKEKQRQKDVETSKGKQSKPA